MKKVGIIGAGLSGLVTAKTLREHGFDVVVFEKEAELGGVWASTRRYPGVTTQNTRDTYAFSDFPMPKHYDEWPSGQQVQTYLTDYARHFGLLPHIHANTYVDKAEAIVGGIGGWVLRIVRNGKPFAVAVDFLVVCNGTYSEPNLPAIPGRESFAGEVVHSSGFRQEHLEAARTARVAVVGFAKSAHDILSQVGSVAAQKPVSIYRRVRWKMPRIFWGINIKYLLLHRFGESLFPYRNLYGIHKLLHGPLGTPLTRLLVKGLGRLVTRQLRLTQSDLMPDQPFESMANCMLGLTSDHVFERAARGDIQLEKGEVSRFVEHGVVLNNGKTVAADLVVFATGFRQTIPFFDPMIIQKLRDGSGLFQLYRNVLPAEVPNLAFVGYNASLFTPITSELAAHYTAQYLKGQLRLPTKPEMKAEIARHQQWLLQRAPDHHSSGTCVAPFSLHHVDELMRDMGLPTRRTWNPIREFIAPFDPGMYRNLMQELAAQPPNSFRRLVIKTRKSAGSEMP